MSSKIIWVIGLCLWTNWSMCTTYRITIAKRGTNNKWQILHQVIVKINANNSVNFSTPLDQKIIFAKQETFFSKLLGPTSIVLRSDKKSFYINGIPLCDSLGEIYEKSHRYIFPEHLIPNIESGEELVQIISQNKGKVDCNIFGKLIITGGSHSWHGARQLTDNSIRTIGLYNSKKTQLDNIRHIFDSIQIRENPVINSFKLIPSGPAYLDKNFGDFHIVKKNELTINDFEHMEK